ncbi:MULTISPECIES: DODA-type extradiol aromatic ring-opening family dioxygenase [Paraburkholderia]|uniref:Extradiol dioxygenase PhnC n=2 Tax=Burkholderiaceae TaxID=119060 RepID=Q9ZHH5_9BURK|nr:extradiol dioxygenase PhnC [Paraburkholderia sartisoli]ACT53261.1 extradiol dioxygenase [Burkholderia sp. C3]OWJ56145.1 protocatechuate 3,4-dioxygenase [Burkholderia sp. Bk]
MAKIVGGFMMPHDPLIPATPTAPPAAQREICMHAYAIIVERLRALQVDTVVVIADDHYTLNGPYCIPMAMIGIGDIEGPYEPWLGIPRAQIENNRPLAHHIMQYGLEYGIDWAVSKSLVLDHSATVPIHYAVRPVKGMRAIPVYLNTGIEPFITSWRAHEIGRVIGDAVANWQGDERVAIYGTGGLSHWPGMAEMGAINEGWDRKIMKLVAQGDVESLIALSDEEILRDGGNGGIEIKNWICAMGALGACRGEVIAYEPVAEWVCGCGYMEMKVA